jgi:hypothetical protein
MTETRPLDLSEEGIAECAELIRRAMPHANHMSAEVLDWQYNQNPAGKAFGWNAYQGDTLISHCVVQPLKARLFGEDVRGVLSLNAVSDPDYRRAGMYFELAKKTYEQARADGFAFGVAVTNDQSTPGFVGKIGFQLVCPLQVRLGLGPLARSTAQRAVDLEKTWDRESVDWRLAAPETPYRLISRDRALAVRGRAPRFGIQMLMGEVAAELGPVDRGSVAQVSLGYNPVRLWVGLDPRIAWTRSLYVNVPLRLRPSPLNLLFLDLTGADRLLDPRRVLWSALDFDDF